MLDIALPKGRLGERAHAILAAAGRGCPEILEPGGAWCLKTPRRGCAFSG